MASDEGTVRIIAGKWRSRKIQFHSVPGLRPTTDRVRETLFNWLAPLLPGARCLDLFAGTGVFGFESLSRGAREAVCVDQSLVAVQAIKVNAQRLAADGLSVKLESAINFLSSADIGRFDIIFLDPPFSGVDLEPLVAAIEAESPYNTGCRIYLESSTSCDFNSFPGNWVLLKDKKTKSLRYRLFEVIAV